MKIVTENIITFKRLDASLCSGYKIIATEIINNEPIEYLVDEIENPKVEQLVSEKIEITFNEKRKWVLSEEIVASDSNSIKLFINDIVVDTNEYTYSPQLRLLEVYRKGLTANDLIEIEYGVDRIKYNHNSENKCSYKVVPIYRKSHSIGQHNFL